jgi:DNA adenine methylase
VSVPKPFIKWAGGKTQMLETLYPLVMKRLAVSGKYFEPFLGGGALALQMVGVDVVASDANDDLIEVWDVVRRNPHQLSLRLERMRAAHSKDFYYKTRELEATNALDRAARFIYLNKMGFNGLYRVNRKTGKFNVPIGRGRPTSIPTYSELVAISSVLTKYWRLESLDFETVIEEAEAGDVVFADPPYDGTFDYTSGFSDKDRWRLASCLRRAARRGVGVIATDADTPRVREMYAWARIRAYDERRRIAANGDRRDAGCVVIVRP